jgi:4-amino-4-deoxy-L-arabinose transferase-like glycosyltransferase
MRFMSSALIRLKLVPEWIWVIIIYLVTHLPSLTLLPVFADEAIYIRWAQLIQDDAGRYAFFSMADGKPPLFMWALSIVLKFFSDPLLGGRLLSLLIGLLTVFVMRKLIREFTKEAIARWVVTLSVILLPFWYFYHRMALMDGLLTLLLSSSFFFAVRLSKGMDLSLRKRVLLLAGLALSFAGSLMTKTPALFAIPVIAFTPIYFWLQTKRKVPDLLRALAWVGVAGVIGCLIFLSLRISPLFGSLFARSTDFTFTFKDLISGEWRYVLGNSLKRNLGWIGFYLTPGIVLIAFLGIFIKKIRSNVLFLLTSAALFFAPLTLFGRVLWPRYFLPTIIFITLASALSFSEAIKQKTLRTISFLFLGLSGIISVYFVAVSFVNPANLPFVPEDSSQYLYEWSAGYGNSQVRDFIRERQAALPKDGSKRIIVLTEGSFGTLPDGLLMYFHAGDNAKTMEVHGIGVGVPRIPEEYIEAAKNNEVYYVLNSHRFGIADQSNLKKVFEIERPASPKGKSPSLLFFQVNPR